MLTRTRGLLLLYVLALSGAVPAAQETSSSVGIAYQFLDQGDQSYPAGIDADVAVRIGKHVAAVGDVGWARGTAQQFGLREVATALDIGGGVRWTGGNDRVRAFGQVILGVERDTTSIERFGSDSVANLLLRPGAGIVVRLSHRQDLFGQVDLRRVFREDDITNAADVLVGVRFHFR